MKCLVLILSLSISQCLFATPSENLIHKLKSEGIKHGFSSAGLIVYKIGSDTPLFESSYAAFSFKNQLAVASAAKWITAATILTLVKQRKLSLTDTTLQILGKEWSGDKSKINLADLLSFTSGIKQQVSCIAIPFISLKKCTQTLSKKALEAAPAELFSYANTHLIVAAHMAEVVSGKEFNELFKQQIADPLGFAPKTRYYTFPRRRIGANPWPAGGLVISTNDYIKFLMMISQYGQYDGKQILTEDLVKEMEKDRFTPGMRAECDPLKENGQCLHYGLGHWVENEYVHSSGGSMGFFPWIDRKNQYIAIFATQEGLKNSQKAYDLVKTLRPLITPLL